MKTPLKIPLLLLVACVSFGAVYPEAPLAQSCYTAASGNPAYRFSEGPVQQCNVDGVYGSTFIGPPINHQPRSNSEVRQIYKDAIRGAKRAYDDGTRCVTKLRSSKDTDSELADDHLYHLQTEYEDMVAAWEDWYEKFGGNMCD